MASHGHIKLSRKMFDGHDDLWSDGTPFDVRSAWVDLIQLAAFKPHRKRVGNQFVSVERGELLASLRFLAERWSWGRHRVANYLEMLEDIGRLGTVRGTLSGTVYRLVNYEDYQVGGDKQGDSIGDAEGTGRGQVGDKENERSTGTKGTKKEQDQNLKFKIYESENGIRTPDVPGIQAFVANLGLAAAKAEVRDSTDVAEVLHGFFPPTRPGAGANPAITRWRGRLQDHEIAAALRYMRRQTYYNADKEPLTWGQLSDEHCKRVIVAGLNTIWKERA